MSFANVSHSALLTDVRNTILKCRACDSLDSILLGVIPTAILAVVPNLGCSSNTSGVAVSVCN